MEKQPESIGNVQAALDAFAKGYTVVAMKPRTKEPAEKWKRWLSQEMTAESVYERWEGTDYGIALYCHNLLVIDVDDANRLDFVLEKSGLKHAPICQTPRGGYHVHGRLRSGVELVRKIDLKGWAIDLLTKDSLSIIPRSCGADGSPYRWLGEGLPPISELPYVNIGWTRERRPTISKAPLMPTAMVNDGIKDIRAYIRRIPSVEGQGGNKGLMRVSFLLAERLDFDAALAELERWNEEVPVPIWSQAELIRALTSAFKIKLRQRMQ